MGEDGGGGRRRRGCLLPSLRSVAFTQELNKLNKERAASDVVRENPRR
jgi:hypothetical protein